MVEKIAISAPSVLLEQGVLLIDTPGLDDPERFRVTLTEDVVQDVDAVLFLTKSGASYGQTEKDFVLSLLRRGTIKQLIFVVTQVDHTYGQHIEQASGDEENPQSITRRMDQERQRLRNQIDATFGALTDAAVGSSSIARYREQLGDVQIIFTSAINHRRHKEGKQVEHPLNFTDPGGMVGVESTLMEVLSTESRLAHVTMALRVGAVAEIDEILRLIDARKIAVHGVKDKEVAEQTLGSFRNRFEAAGKAFERTVDADLQLFRQEIEGGQKLTQARTETIVLSATLVLRGFETDDAARHWRSRRNGNWGYMHGLQLKVANAIFPKVTELLIEQQTEFECFVRNFETHLATLTDESTRIRTELGVGAQIRIDVASRLKTFLDRTLTALQGLIETEEATINKLLEEFVSEQVEDNITEMRSAVSDCWGTGTTAAQTRKVNEFYAQVNGILRNALQEYLLTRIKQHRDILFAKAEALPSMAWSEVQAELERIAADIKAAAVAASTEQKAAFDATAGRLTASLQKYSQTLAALNGSNDQPTATTTVTPNGALPAVETTKAAESTVVTLMSPPMPLSASTDEIRIETEPSDWSAIRKNATTFLRRFDLFSGQSKWGWGKIFEERFVRNASSAILVDTYLDKAHQRRNLGEVVQLLNRSGALKRIHVVTGSHGPTEDAEGDQQLRELAVQLQCLGVELTWDRDDKEHDRYLLLSNGVRFDLGIGLDIYAMARNLSLGDPNLRKIRKQTTISVFGPKVPA